MAHRFFSRWAASLLIVGSTLFYDAAHAQSRAPGETEESPTLPEAGAPERLPLVRSPAPSSTSRPAGGSADSQNLKKQFGLLGNLGGVRDVLWEHGILLNMDYVYEGATNLAGGTRGPLVRGAGQFAIRGLFDLQRILDLDGASAGVTLTHRHGRDVTQDAHLGTQTSVEEIYGRGRIWRLSQFWYDQKFGPWIDLKIGRMPSGDDFAVFGCEFQMNVLCGVPTGKITGNYLYNFPVSQWAARLRVGTADSGYVQVGAYQVNPDNLVDGFSFDVRQGTGAIVISEAGWLPKFDSAGMAGSYKVGGWYETGGGPDVFLNDHRLPLAVSNGSPLLRGDHHGGYFVGVQEVYRPDPANPTRNVSAFVRAVAADAETSTYSTLVTAGFIYKGWCAQRPNDWIGFSIGQNTPNARAVDATVMRNLFTGSNKAAPAQERYIEAFYSIDVADNIVIRPNIQYITRSRTPDARPDVVVVGVKSLINF